MIPQSTFNQALQSAYAEALAEQPLYRRRRASLTSLAALVIQAAQVATVYMTDAPIWLAAVIGAVVYAAEVVVQAGSQNGLGEYHADQIERAAEKAGAVYVEPLPLARSTADLARDLAATSGDYAEEV